MKATRIPDVATVSQGHHGVRLCTVGPNTTMPAEMAREIAHALIVHANKSDRKMGLK